MSLFMHFLSIEIPKKRKKEYFFYSFLMRYNLDCFKNSLDKFFRTETYFNNLKTETMFLY